MKIYGYCRISTQKQSITRQIKNIMAIYPNAEVVEEQFTGTKIEGRKEFTKLLSKVQSGDKIVFDSVSRMSRNSEEGIKLYKDLFNKGIELEFIKEPHINTTTYKKALQDNIQLTGTNLDFILEGINKYLLSLAEEQIKLAFMQAEKEVKDLQQRTKEGIREAKAKGKVVGQPKGTKLKTKRGAEIKEKILKYSKCFNATGFSDKECMEIIGTTRNTYYKYKKELLEELEGK